MPYQFKDNERVKLKSFAAYSSRGLTVWAWLSIVSVSGKSAKVEILNGDQSTGQMIDVPVSELQTPIGFEEVYEVTVKDAEQARKMLGWIKDRGGVQVWASLDLGSPGNMSYTPGDVEGKPHWSMGPVETVKDPKRFKFTVETEIYEKPKEAGWKYDRRARSWYKREPIAL